jgi:hypothetical protein
VATAKKPLHPALRANAERLKRGEPLHGGKRKTTAVSAPPARPKIRSAKSRKG